MDKSETINALQAIYNLLNEIEIKGGTNISMMYKALYILEDTIKNLNEKKEENN